MPVDDHRWGTMMLFSIAVEQEEDGRWLTDIPELPGVLA